jgi:hypothetical protein
METKDWVWWNKFREVTRHYLENDEYRMICEIHARIKGTPVEYPCKCNPSKIQNMIDEINDYYAKTVKPKIR